MNHIKGLQQLILLSLANLAASREKSATDTCYALALSGGSNNGAWEAGVIWGMLHYGDPKDFEWQVVSGISAGSMNTAGIAPWAVGDEYAMSEWLTETVQNMTTQNVWVDWPEGEREAWVTEAGLLDSSPLVQFVADILEEFPEGYKRDIIVSSVDANTGEFFHATNENTPLEDFPTVVAASCSIPYIFPPQYYKGMVLMDGGTATGVNFPSAVQKCLEYVEDESQIVLDIYVCAYYEITTTEDVGKTVNNFQRSNQIKDNLPGDLYDFRRAYPNVNYRYLLLEQNGDGGLSFNNSTTWRLQEMGREDAKQAIEHGKGTVFQHLDEWYESPETQSLYPRWIDYVNSFF